eukprot:m.244195 g.244195  ORF g.244195 m.244195 type:complete len:368 (-) comp19468_c0_seq1:3062-4165(-)
MAIMSRSYRLFALVGLSVTSRVSATVTCNLTVDNAIQSMWYNGEVVTARGVYNNWQSIKILTFTEVPGAVLEITAEEYGTCGYGCQTAGLLMVCESPESSSCWNGYRSNNDFTFTKTSGSCFTINRDAITDDDLSAPCSSTSAFYMTGAGDAVKVWPRNGGRYAYFRLAGNVCPPTSSPTQAPTRNPTAMPTMLPTTFTTTTTTTFTTHTVVQGLGREVSQMQMAQNELMSRLSTMSQMLSSTTSALVQSNATLRALISTNAQCCSSATSSINAIRSAVASVISALPPVPTAPQTSTACLGGASAEGNTCSGAVEQRDSGEVRIKAPRSTITLESAECGVINPCETRATVRGIVNALQALSGASSSP